MNRPSSDSARLKQRIDAGRTGEKVAALDVAAAPLGTDDEAAQNRPQGHRERDATDGELMLGRAESQEDNRAPASSQPSAGTWYAILGGMGALAVVGVTLTYVFA
ncbi:hypothetical protein GCM10007301_29220 [Azorhizobium oxalatiphilum]|uniref:Uncharacterized protein n=2 Tax=Azorhizobium oxalatiphilum TaxID=980631 RepID=A0A917C1E0_9HYPH|nr:hypothetical protein GCM10007301_29220 [Azorhizobium oxalatiphilum]